MLRACRQQKATIRLTSGSTPAASELAMDFTSSRTVGDLGIYGDWPDKSRIWGRTATPYASGLSRFALGISPWPPPCHGRAWPVGPRLSDRCQVRALLSS